MLSQALTQPHTGQSMFGMSGTKTHLINEAEPPSTRAMLQKGPGKWGCVYPVYLYYIKAHIIKTLVILDDPSSMSVPLSQWLLLVSEGRVRF